MSVQYGRWNFDGRLLGLDNLEKISALLAAYGPDSNETYSASGVKILYRAFHTTKESHVETQPSISRSGAVITWDGRLDNRSELVSQLIDSVCVTSTDVDIVTAAYNKWDTNCLARLIGDWALSVWNPIDRSLILAKDPIGTRHLYYILEKDNVSWCTILDPLVLFAGKSFAISEEYIAGYFVHLAATHLTPYVGIHAVPPSSFVLVRPGKITTTTYWDFDPGKRIRYRTDAEYEEHFRMALAAAVRRRLRADRPILAELSGGMDSSSIVCVADLMIAQGEPDIQCLDTISYYDDSDPSMNERPYVTKVEQRLGRTGYHIDLGARRQLERAEVRSPKPFVVEFESDRLAATPDFDPSWWPEIFDEYAGYMKSRQYRVTLSGIAAEAPTGGYVPTPTIEFQNLLARARLFRLARQLPAWAQKMGKPPLPLLWEALRGFFAHSLASPWAPKAICPAPWFQADFVERNQAALSWYPSKLKLFGALPSFQNQVYLLNHFQRCLAYCSPRPELLREIRYPYLDRDLLEFACAIPQEQMVGVGKRRFLMKRALAGIVPDELLNRKRRELAVQTTEGDISTEWPSLAEMGNQLLSGSLGIVDSNLFLKALEKARRKEDISLKSLKRTIFLEYWLRHLATRGILTTTPMLAKRPRFSSFEAKKLRAPIQPESSVS